MEFDTLFRNAMVVDGSGAEPFVADVGTREGRIAAIGSMPEALAGRMVNADGLCLSPGFIDIHSHSDLSLTVDPLGLSKITQGVTTEVNGNCGFSPFPSGGAGDQLLRPLFGAIDYPDARWGWATVRGDGDGGGRAGGGGRSAYGAPPRPGAAAPVVNRSDSLE